MKNTSVSLGAYFDQFVTSQISIGRYKNVSEVIRAGLRLLEDEENKSDFIIKIFEMTTYIKIFQFIYLLKQVIKYRNKYKSVCKL